MTNNQSHNIFQSLLVIGYCIFVIYFTHGQKACSCVASLTPLDKLTEHFFFFFNGEWKKDKREAMKNDNADSDIHI